MININFGGATINRPGAFAIVTTPFSVNNANKGDDDMWVDVITESFEGTADTTVTFSAAVTGLCLQNRGTADLIFTIPSTVKPISITIPPSGMFSGYFDRFSQVVIKGGAYNGFVTRAVERK